MAAESAAPSTPITFRIGTRHPLFNIARVLKLHPHFAHTFGIMVHDSDANESIEFLVDESEINRRVRNDHFRYKFIKTYERGIGPLELLTSVSGGVWPLATTWQFQKLNESWENMQTSHPARQRYFDGVLGSDAIIYEFPTQAFYLPLLHPHLVKRMELFSRVALFLNANLEGEDDEVKDLAFKTAVYTATHMRVALAHIGNYDFGFSPPEERRDPNQWARRAMAVTGDTSTPLHNDIVDVRLMREMGELLGRVLDPNLNLPYSLPYLMSPMNFTELRVRMSDALKGVREPAQLITKFLSMIREEGLPISDDAVQKLQREMFLIRKETPQMPSDEELQDHVDIVLGRKNCTDFVKLPPVRNSATVTPFRR